MTSVSSSSSSGSIAQLLMQSMQKARADMFKKADADGSGGVSLDEFKALGSQDANATQDTKAVEAMFTKLDTDGDGSLTQAEMDAGAPPQDVGMLSQKVLAALLDILGNEDDTSTDSTDSADASRSSSPPPPPPSDETTDASDAQQIFDALDTNKDGVVSIDELAQALTSTSSTSSDSASASTTSTSSNDSLIAELKTAVKSFLLSLQEQQQQNQIA